MSITTQSRVERMEFLYRRIINVTTLWQLFSGLTYGLGGYFLIVSKLQGWDLPFWWDLSIRVLAAIVAGVFAYVWERALRIIWKEVTTNIFHWEFENWAATLLFFILFPTGVFMSYVSIKGSWIGAEESGEVVIQDQNNDQLTALVFATDSSVITNNLVINQKRSFLLKEYNSIRESIEAQYEAQLAPLPAKAAKYKAQYDSTQNAKALANYQWLAINRPASILKQKTKDLADAQANYQRKLQALDQDSTVQQAQSLQTALLSAANDQQQNRLARNEKRRLRHSLSFGSLAIVVTPLFILSMAIQALILRALNKVSDPLPEIDRKAVPKGFRQKTKTAATPKQSAVKQDVKPENKAQLQIEDIRYKKQKAQLYWKRGFTSKGEATRDENTAKARALIASLKTLGVHTSKDPNNQQRLIFTDTVKRD